MPANYDHIADIYDALSRLIFGTAIVDAQVSLLSHISAGSRILIIGGGTGWILENISRIHSEGLTIDYVESSARMISLSTKRSYKQNNVNFIRKPIEDFDSDLLYDVIITPFILDNFKSDKLSQVFMKLDAMLLSSGLWLYADFMYDKKTSTLWQKGLLKIMYLFFAITTRIETQQLINPEDMFRSQKYGQVLENWWYAGFIRSAVYRKGQIELIPYSMYQ